MRSRTTLSCTAISIPSSLPQRHGGSGYLVTRPPNGSDSLLVHAGLTDGDGRYEIANDCALDHALPDNDDWKELLAIHRSRGTHFVDPVFPPSAKSLGQKQKGDADEGFAEKVTSWRRVADIFRVEHALTLTFSEQDPPKCCGCSQKMTGCSQKLRAVRYVSSTDAHSRRSRRRFGSDRAEPAAVHRSW